MNAALALAQRQYLWRRARKTGVWRHVFAHHALLGEWDHFHAAETEAEACADADALTRDALLLGREPGRIHAVRERLRADAGTLPLHLAARFYCAQGAADELIALTECALSRETPDLSLVNWVAKVFHATGNTQAARTLIDVSIELGGQQEDLAPWRDGIASRQAPPVGLLPARESVSFYVPVYNVSRYIQQAIEGLLAQSYPLEEILVIDDGTEDDAIERARPYPVRIVAHEENRGLGAARNTAFTSASSEFLGAIDTDAAPDPDFAVHAMLAWENAVPEVAGVGGRMFEAYTEADADLWRARHLGQDCGPLRRCPTGLFGACTVHRRRDVLAVGGFEEKCRTNAEDWYLGRALEAAGRCLEYTPHAVAWHQRRDTADSVMRTMWRWAFWRRQEMGDFAPGALLSQGLAATLAQARHCYEHDRDNKAPQLYRLDWLYAYYGALMDLRHGADTRALTTGEAAALQRGLLATASAAQSFSWLMGQTEPLLLDPDAAPRPAPVMDQFRAFTEELSP